MFAPSLAPRDSEDSYRDFFPLMHKELLLYLVNQPIERKDETW